MMEKRVEICRCNIRVTMLSPIQRVIHDFSLHLKTIGFYYKIQHPKDEIEIIHNDLEFSTVFQSSQKISILNLFSMLQTCYKVIPGYPQLSTVLTPESKTLLFETKLGLKTQ